jgi:hypothetical protein
LVSSKYASSVVRRTPLLSLLAFSVLVVACDQGGTIMVSAIPTAPDTFGVRRVGAPQKLYQLIGDLDREYDPPRPTYLRTESTVGLFGADLGYPVVHQGKLYLFFADGLTPYYEERRPRDADVVAVVDDPSPDRPLDLRFVTDDDGRWHALTLDGVAQGSNHVPVSGFSDGQRLWLFYYVDPTNSGGGGGYQKLAYDVDGHGSFQSVLDVPIQMEFTVPRVVPSSSVPGLPSDWADPQALVMWGRSGILPPTLAVAPLGSVTDLSTWRYYAPLAADGPWSAHVENGVQVYAGTGGYDCRGPFSVVPIPQMGRWVMLERCVPSFIHMRVAESIVGPWSPAITLFDSIGDGAAGKYMHRGCNAQQTDSSAPDYCVDQNVTPSVCCDYTLGLYGYMNDGQLRPPDEDQGFSWVGRDSASDSRPYAPFVVEPMTQWDPSTSTATLYFLMSTSNPYTVMMMKAPITLDP